MVAGLVVVLQFQRFMVAAILAVIVALPGTYTVWQLVPVVVKWFWRQICAYWQWLVFLTLNFFFAYLLFSHVEARVEQYRLVEWLNQYFIIDPLYAWMSAVPDRLYAYLTQWMSPTECPAP